MAIRKNCEFAIWIRNSQNLRICEFANPPSQVYMYTCTYVYSILMSSINNLLNALFPIHQHMNSMLWKVPIHLNSMLWFEKHPFTKHINIVHLCIHVHTYMYINVLYMYSVHVHIHMYIVHTYIHCTCTYYMYIVHCTYIHTSDKK